MAVQTVTEPPLVDSQGNIWLNGRSDLDMLLGFNDGTTSDPTVPNRDVSAAELYFEVNGILRVPLAAGDTVYTRRLQLDDAQVQALPLAAWPPGVSPMPARRWSPPGAYFALRDETNRLAQVLWEGVIAVRNFIVQPPTGPA